MNGKQWLAVAWVSLCGAMGCNTPRPTLQDFVPATATRVPPPPTGARLGQYYRSRNSLSATESGREQVDQVELASLNSTADAPLPGRVEPAGFVSPIESSGQPPIRSTTDEGSTGLNLRGMPVSDATQLPETQQTDTVIEAQGTSPRMNPSGSVRSTGSSTPLQWRRREF